MKLFALIGLLFLIGCGDSMLSSDSAKAFLVEEGYTNIQLTGSAAALCGNLGPGAVGFKATSPRGTPAVGAVCEGFNSGKVIVRE